MFHDHDLSINWEECDPLTPALFSLLHRIISHLPTITHTAFSRNLHPAPLNTLTLTNIGEGDEAESPEMLMLV